MLSVYFKGILFIIGGICLFFWGMDFFSKGVTEFFNAKNFFAKKRLNKFGYYFLGAATTAVIQSSDATTILAMNMAEEKLLDKKNAVSVTLGARLGTTVTALWASIGELNVSPTIFAAALCVALLLPKKYSKVKRVLFGAGLFFGGLIILDFGSAFVQPLVRSLFQDNGNHFLLFLIGLSITAVLQSSSAVTSVLAIMTINEAMSLENAVFLLIGATVGTTVTPLLAGLKMSKTAKYVATCHIAFSLLSGLIALPIVHVSAKVIFAILDKTPKTLSLAIFCSLYGFASSFACLLCQTPLEKGFSKFQTLFEKYKPKKIKKMRTE